MRPKYFLRSIALGLVLFGGSSLRAWPSPDPPFLVLQAGPQESVASVAFSPDGSLVASGSLDGRVRVYDARTGALLRAIGSDPSRGMHAVAFAPDGKSLAGAGIEMDKTFKIWEPRTGSLLRSLTGHKTADPGNLYAETHAIAFSPVGKLVASAGRDGLVLVWDLETGGLAHRLTGHEGSAISVAFTPDGETLASGAGDGGIRLWDPRTGGLKRVLKGHRDGVCTLAFAPDGKTMASGVSDWAHHRGRDASRFEGRDPGYDGEVKLWNTSTWEVSRVLTERGRVSSLAFAPDGRSLACGIGDAVRLYGLKTSGTGEVLVRHDGGVTSVAFAPDGRAIASGSHDRTVVLTALPARERVWVAPGYWEQVNSVALSPDGSLIATGSSDIRFAERKVEANARRLGPGAVRLWDARTGRLLRRLGDPAEQVMAVAFTPDGRRVASVGRAPDGSGAVRLWDVTSGAQAWAGADHRAEVLAIAIAADGKTLASAGADGLIKLRDAATGSVKQTLEGHEGAVTSVAFSADGATLASGGADESARLWDVATGRPIRTLQPAGMLGMLRRKLSPGGERLMASVALSPDGATLAACGGTPDYDDRPVRVWDTRSGRLIRELKRPQCRGRFVALSSDGTILASNGVGKSIALWDLRTGQLLRELEGHPHPPQSAAFSADGRILVSGADYRTTKVWEVATGRLLATLSTFSESRPGTAADDWLAYTPDGSYDGSAGIDRFLAWRVGDDLRTADRLQPQLHRPDRLESALKLPHRDPASP